MRTSKVVRAPIWTLAVAVGLQLLTEQSAQAQPPEDPVVFEPHPDDVAEERAEQIAFTADPELDDAPLTIYAPIHQREEVTVHEQTVVVEQPAPARAVWLGLSMSPVLAPVPASGLVGRGETSLTSNRFRACVYPDRGGTCGVVKGFDFKVPLFVAGGPRQYPRAIGYLRTGYGGGRVAIEPRAGGAQPGDATSIRYLSVPVFVGANVYLVKDFPLRPYGGLGAGVDILRLDHARYQQSSLIDISGRVGLEVHAGLEGRLSNYVALHAEVMQQWSPRRRLEGVPDVSMTGLSVLAGVTVTIPVWYAGSSGNQTTVVRHSHRHTVRR